MHSGRLSGIAAFYEISVLTINLSFYVCKFGRPSPTSLCGPHVGQAHRRCGIMIRDARSACRSSPCVVTDLCLLSFPTSLSSNTFGQGLRGRGRSMP